MVVEAQRTHVRHLNVLNENIEVTNMSSLSFNHAPPSHLSRAPSHLFPETTLNMSLESHEESPRRDVTATVHATEDSPARTTTATAANRETPLNSNDVTRVLGARTRRKKPRNREKNQDFTPENRDSGEPHVKTKSRASAVEPVRHTPSRNVSFNPNRSQPLFTSSVLSLAAPASTQRGVSISFDNLSFLPDSPLNVTSSRNANSNAPNADATAIQHTGRPDSTKSLWQLMVKLCWDPPPNFPNMEM